MQTCPNNIQPYLIVRTLMTDIYTHGCHHFLNKFLPYEIGIIPSSQNFAIYYYATSKLLTL